MGTDILIAEADTKLCGTYKHMFDGSGLLVETAADGLDCWTKLRASSPDALMIDVNLLWGGSDGVLARLREDSDGEAYPEVFVMGDDPPGCSLGRVGIAAERCFRKPLEMGTVVDSICDVFASDEEITFLDDPS